MPRFKKRTKTIISQALTSRYLREGVRLRGFANARFAALLVTALSLASLGFGTGTAAQGPGIAFTGPEDGSWFTDENVTVRGNATTCPQDLVLDVTEIGPGSGRDIELAGEVLRFSPKLRFIEDFGGTALNTSNWTKVRDRGSIAVKDGCLLLDNDSFRFPLVRSNGGHTPTGSDWTAGFRLRLRYLGPGGDGGGISDQDPDLASSLMAVYQRTITPNPYGYKVLADGEAVLNESSNLQWHNYYLDWSPDDGRYTVYRDWVELGRYEGAEARPSFWFGNCDSGAPQYYGLTVDYADVWTFAGTWASRTVDMGSIVHIDRASARWESDHPSETAVRSEVRSSLDNTTWTEWTSVAGGTPSTAVEGRYLQSRFRVSMVGVRDEDAYVDLRNLTLGFKHPLTRVDVRCNGGEWNQATGLNQWEATVALREDWNSVEARVTDTDGGTSTTVIDLLLDTTPPVGTAKVLSDRPYTNDVNVTLLLNATDKYGVVTVEVCDYPDFRGASAFPYAERLAWRVQGGFGPNLIYVRFIDSHGLVSAPVNATVYFDPYPPQGHISVNGGEPCTDERSVRLDLEHSDETGVALVELSNDGAFTDPSIVPLGTTSIDGWTLAGGDDGVRTVHMRLTDMAGNAQVLNDSIELYIPKPSGSVLIEDGAEATNRTIVHLAIGVPRELRATRMQLSLDPDFLGMEWEAVAPERMVILPPGDRTVSIHVRFLDFRGITSLPVSDSIVLDTTPPAINITLDGGSRYTLDGTISVELGYDDASPPGVMRVCGDGRFDLSQPRPFEALFDWVVPEREGDHEVFVMVADAAGNSVEACATVHYATIPPVLDLTFVGGAVVNGSGDLLVSVGWQDPYGGVEVQLSVDEEPPLDGPWRGCDAPLRVGMPPAVPDGAHWVRARARDAAGLVTDVSSWPFTIDRTAPNVRVVDPGEGAVIVQTDLVVHVRFTVEDGTGAARVAHRVDGGGWTVLGNASHREFDLELDGFGRHKVEIEVIDPASNAGSASVEFELERSVGPQGSRLLDGLLLAAIAIGCAAVALVILRTKRRARSR